MKFANAYHVEQCYGGPEEGGWYFDAGYPIKSIRLGKNPGLRRIKAARKQLCRELEAEHAAGVDGRPEYTSVLSEGDLRIHIENHQARLWPESRPYYE